MTGSNLVELHKFTSKLNDIFSLKDLGSLHYFLGLEVTRDETGLFITQKKYIQDLLVKFNMQEVSSCPTPMVTGKKIVADEGEALQNPTMFKKLVGALQYVTNKRSNISFSVNKLSRFINSPTLKHWQAAKRVLRYLKGTTDLTLHLKPYAQLSLTGYYDADWVVSHDDRRSVTGYCVYLGNSLVSWSSKRQSGVS